MSSDRCTSVARPAQYTDDRCCGPSASRAATKSRRLPVATSMPAFRKRRPNSTATSAASATAVRRLLHERRDSPCAYALLVLAVLDDAPEGHVDRHLVEPV